MKKSLIALAALAAASAAMAQAVTQIPMPTWPQCENKGYTNSTVAVCHEAVDRLQLRQVPITPANLQAEMQKVSDEDTRTFYRLYTSGGPHGGAVTTRQ